MGALEATVTTQPQEHPRPNHLLPDLRSFSWLTLHKFACEFVVGGGRPMDRHKSPVTPSQSCHRFPSGRFSRVVVGPGVGRTDESLLVE